MPQVSAAVLRSTPSSTSASASIRRAAAPSFSPLAALRSSEAVRSSRVIDTAAPIDAAPLKGQHRVRVSLIWESLMSHSFGPLVLVTTSTPENPAFPHAMVYGLFRVLPGARLSDSHILEPQSGTVFDAAEVFEAYSHHLWTGLSVIGG